jgi:actin related protein 2/3 complex subunit 2
VVSLAKASKTTLRTGFRAVVDKIKRLRLRIVRVRGLDRLRRQCRCFAVPKLPPRRKERGYRKLTVTEQ